ncbi:MAG TPA: mechanosensitive ion channel domain-containing protein [Bacteroidia bacterium]|nr:mechanosensitive ion channel domain-containing protein [Bacteroidia bacterium]
MKKALSILFKILVLGAAIYARYLSEYVPKTPTERNVIYTTLRLVMVLIVLNLVYEVMKSIYRSRNRIKGLVHDGFLQGLRNLFLLFSGLVVGATLFGFFGIDFKTLFTTLSIVAAAIAIVTKEFINDMIVGIFLGFSKDFEIGDYVKIADEKGKIVEIGLTKIKLLNDDDDLMIIPNNKVYSSEVTNYTKRDIRILSIDFQIAIAKITSIDALESDLIHSLDSFAEYIHEDSFLLKIVEVKKEHLDLKFQYRLKNLDREMQRQIRRKTVRQVLSYVTQKPSLERIEKA